MVVTNETMDDGSIAEAQNNANGGSVAAPDASKAVQAAAAPSGGGQAASDGSDGKREPKTPRASNCDDRDAAKPVEKSEAEGEKRCVLMCL